MAESDPKKLRPFAQSPARRDLDSEDDPLVELARIVSEDSTYYGNRTARPKPQPQEPIERSTPSADLESELLQELDRSFAPRSHAVPVAGPARQAEASPPALPAMPRDNADDLLRSIEEQLGAFERRAQAMRSPGADAPPDDQVRGDRPAPLPDDLPNQPAPRAGRLRRAGAEAQRSRGAAPAGADGVAIQGPAAAQEPEAVPPRPGRRVEARFARGVPPRNGADARQIEPAPASVPDPTAETAAASRSPTAEPARRGAARSGFAAGAASGWREIESEDGSPDSGQTADRLSSRVELPREFRTTFDEGNEAHGSRQLAGYPMTHHGAELTDRLEPTHADPTFGARWEEAADPSPRVSADEPRVAATAGSGAGIETPAFRRRRARRRGLMTAAALLALVAVGGGVAAYMRNSDNAGSGPPPVIAAPDGADKVLALPDAQQAEGETVGEAVYNRVAGTAPTEGDQVVDGAEEPQEIATLVPPAAEGAPEPEPPPPLASAEPADPEPLAPLRPDADDIPTGTTQAAAPEVATPAPPAGADPAGEPVRVGPRRVRTFVVRPDGTIATVEEPAGEAEAEAELPANPGADERSAAVAAEAAPAEPVRVATTDIDGGESPNPPEGPVSDAGFDAAPGAAGTPEPPAPAPAPSTADAAAGNAGALQPPRAAEPPDADAQPSAETETAALQPDPASETPILPDFDTDSPADTPASPAAAAPDATGALAAVTPSPNAAEATAAPAAADGFVVQISSQRSEAQAKSAYAGLQKRFPSVLGGLQPDIQQADLGAKGVFFRVRVGPYPSRAEAIEVCESLQAAGGSCFVTR